ncbi:MAG: Glyoxalase family protein [uncultured Paraburkholderia sp.]|nr:MAG: Glyoxalase family protein [uncultured Paraburkholderia sp.]CAH2933200.1 MAG: Glyoxalase family protein [uncultured Paraburkholderia sp.]
MDARFDPRSFKLRLLSLQGDVMSESLHRPSFGAALYYKDPLAALEWLERAFGFTRQLVITDDAGQLAHSEMRYGDSYVMISREWSADSVSPVTVSGKNTQSVHVQLSDGIDQHCARARAAGAVITREPADQFYGDRVYAARDPEGHIWSFGQTVRAVSREEAERASGLNIEGWI